jgi:AcrR family transcriptional regulator
MTARTLTEEAIVDAALRVIRNSGVESLTMRALSRELGMSPMAAYYYVANKEELLDLVAARALADIRLPRSATAPWPVRLRTLIDRIDEALRNYRGVGEVLLDRMHRTQKHVMRAVMELLGEAGFGDAEIAMAYALIHTYLFGRYRVTMSAPPPVEHVADDPDDVVARVGPLSTALHGRDYYDFGVDTLIRGLESRLAAAGPSEGRRRDRTG